MFTLHGRRASLPYNFCHGVYRCSLWHPILSSNISHPFLPHSCAPYFILSSYLLFPSLSLPFHLGQGLFVITSPALAAIPSPGELHLPFPMAALSVHRESSLPRAREATDLKALLRSLSRSAKAKVRIPNRLLPSRSTKSNRTSAAASSTTTAPAAHTQDINNHAPYCALSPSSTCVGDETAIQPPAPVFLDTKKLNYRDSGVAFLPDYPSVVRNSTRHTLAIREKHLHPEGIRPRLDIASSRLPDRTGVEKSTVVAVRSLDKSKCSARTSTRLSPTVLQLFLNSAMESMKAALHLHRGCGEDSYSSKRTLYYSEVLAALRILSKYLRAYSGFSNCSKSLDVWKAFAENSLLRSSVLPGLLDPAEFFLTGDASCRTLFGCSEASNLLVVTIPNQEHGTNQGKRPASTERSASNSQKRSRTSRNRPGEESEHRLRGSSGKGGRNNGDEGDENNDGNDRGTELAPTEHLGNEGQLTFACPFYKHDPIAHRSCIFRHTSTKTNYVKQHLRRHHLQPRHCPICGEKFGAESEKNDHIRSSTCEQQEFQHAGLTESQREQIEQIPRSEQPEERWYKMWDIIFPGEPRPASPYIRDPWIEVVDTHTALWAERGGPDRVLESEGVVLSRPGHAAQGQNSANSNAAVWQAFRADMISSAENFIRDGAEPAYPASSQQLEQQSLTGSFSSYDMVPQHNNTASSQTQAGTPSIPVPTRATDHPGTSRPRPPTVDSGISMPRSTTSSGSNRKRLYSTRAGVGQAGRQGQARPQQPITPQISPPHETQPLVTLSDSFQGGLATDASYRMFMPEAYDTIQSLDPALLGQSSERAVSMDRSLSHKSLPEQTLRMMRAGMPFDGAQGGVTRERGGFQPPLGFYGNAQNQGSMQGGRRHVQRTSRSQVAFGNGLGNNQMSNDLQGDLPFSPVSGGVGGTQSSPQGLGQPQGGFGSGFRSDGVLATSPGPQTGWRNIQGPGQAGIGSSLQLGGQSQPTGEGMFGAGVVPGNAQGTPGAWGNIESPGQGGRVGDGTGDGQGQAGDGYLYDFTYQYDDPPM